MRHTFSAIVIISCMALSHTGCRKNYDISNRQEVLFQYEYINYAWSYQHNGFIIDSQGNILTFSNPENWNFTDKDEILTEEQVNQNTSLCKNSGKKIPESELQKYSGYIKNIASSEVTAPKNVGADMGSAEYICYQFSESTGYYKKHLIKMEGDFTSENLNFYSKKVLLWMKDINSGLSLN